MSFPSFYALSASAPKIEVRMVDYDGSFFSRDFDTIKEAKAWIKDCAMDPDYHNRSAESDYLPETWCNRSIHRIQLWKGEECREDLSPPWDYHFKIRGGGYFTIKPLRLEYLPWEGVGSIGIPLSREADLDEIVHELTTKGRVSDETREAWFLT